MELKDFFEGEPLPEDLLQMQSYLKGARREPSMDYGYINSEGSYSPSRNHVWVDPRQSLPDAQNTAMHEYTHAAKNQMERQYLDYGKRLRDGVGSSLDSQFREAYSKMADVERPALNTEVPSAGYRWNNRDEARAFGIANMNIPKGNGNPKDVPAHYDASAAQEHAILFELARRAALQSRQTPPTMIQSLKNLFK